MGIVLIGRGFDTLFRVHVKDLGISSAILLSFELVFEAYQKSSN